MNIIIIQKNVLLYYIEDNLFLNLYIENLRVVYFIGVYQSLY